MGGRAYRSIVAATFTGEGQDRLLHLRGYDIDYVDEIGIDLNGSPLVGLPRGVNRGWSEPDHLVLPPDVLNAGDNLILIRNLHSSGYDWGLRLDRLLPMGEPLGHRLPGQAVQDQRPSAVRYLLAPAATDMALTLGYYDVDYADELEIRQDGLSLGHAAKSANNAWGGPDAVIIPGGLRALIEVDNTYVPGTNYIWGVRVEGYR